MKGRWIIYAFLPIYFLGGWLVDMKSSQKANITNLLIPPAYALEIEKSNPPENYWQWELYDNLYGYNFTITAGEKHDFQRAGVCPNPEFGGFCYVIRTYPNQWEEISGKVLVALFNPIRGILELPPSVSEPFPHQNRLSLPKNHILYFLRNEDGIPVIRLPARFYLRQSYRTYHLASPEELKKYTGLIKIPYPYYVMETEWKEIAFDSLLDEFAKITYSKNFIEFLYNTLGDSLFKQGNENPQRFWDSYKEQVYALKECSKIIAETEAGLQVRGERPGDNHGFLAFQDACQKTKQVVDSYHETFYLLGEYTQEEVLAIQRYIQYQETRCARLPFEEAKKDFECRSIQIRDYLRYGPEGAPPEEMRKRASRPLAPQPPKLPWESSPGSQMQDTSRK